MSSFDRNPVVVDAVMASGFRASVASPFGNVIRIEKLEWIGPTAAGTVTITDPVSSNTLFEMSAPSAGGTYVLDFVANPRIVADFQVSALPSGTLYLYLR